MRFFSVISRTLVREFIQSAEIQSVNSAAPTDVARKYKCFIIADRRLFSQNRYYQILVVINSKSSNIINLANATSWFFTEDHFRSTVHIQCFSCFSIAFSIQNPILFSLFLLVTSQTCIPFAFSLFCFRFPILYPGTLTSFLVCQEVFLFKHSI